MEVTLRIYYIFNITHKYTKIVSLRLTKPVLFDIIKQRKYYAAFYAAFYGGKVLAKVILVTSFKGGVGKTTISANLAMSFAKSGKKVIAVDCDLESRCLDMVLGVEDLPLFNICDAVSKKCGIESAVTKYEESENLFFMPAPAFYPEAVQDTDTSEIFTNDAVKDFIDALKKDYDYIILDLPARPDSLYREAVKFASVIIVVSLHTATSIRAAEKTAIAVSELAGDKANPDIRLIINGFRADDVKNGENVGLYDIISKTHLPLLGVIPYDSDMVRAQEQGMLAETYVPKLDFANAIDNVAERLGGKNVKLLRGIKTGVKNKNIY